MKNAQLDGLVWALVYGGLFMVMLGVWVVDDDAALGHGLGWGGGLAALVGALLIWVRSQRREAPAPPDAGAPR